MSIQEMINQIPFAMGLGRISRMIYLSILVVLFSHCNDKNTKLKNKPIQQDLLVVKQNKQDTEKVLLPISYHLKSVGDTATWLNNLTPGDTLNTLLLLNRVDFQHLLRLDSIIIPDTISSDLMLYSPFPKRIDALLEVHKTLLISYRAQAFGAYENGLFVKWGAASMGKSSTLTPVGLYFTNWKSKETISTVNSDWVMKWYFNIDNYRGVSIHEFALPGYPASHSCIRLSRDDAYWFYYWANQWILSSHTEIDAYGTPVLIYGSYPFEGRKPWVDLTDNPLVLKTMEQKNAVIPDSFISLILKRQALKDSFLKIDNEP